MDIEAVFRACGPKAAREAATGRPRTATAAVGGRGTCRGAGTAAAGPRDFCPFLRDDRGRAISTKTPVAKVTAPVSMARAPRPVDVKRPAAKTGSTRSAGASTTPAGIEADATGLWGNSDAKASTNESTAGEKRQLASGSGRLIGRNNSSNQSASPTTRTALRGTGTPLGVAWVAADGTAGQRNAGKSSNRVAVSDEQVAFGPGSGPGETSPLSVSSASSSATTLKTPGVEVIVASSGQQNSRRSDENSSSNRAAAKMASATARAVETPSAGSAAGEADKSSRRGESKGEKESRDDDRADVEEELNLPDAELERAASLSTFQPGERRRRSPSLQVLCFFKPFIIAFLCLQCFDAVGWAAGRASGL